MFQNKRDVFITKCIVNWNCYKFKKDTCNINYGPLDSVFRKYANKIHLRFLINIEKFFINKGTSHGMTMIEKFIVREVIDCWLVSISFYWSNSIFISIRFFCMYKNIFQSSSSRVGFHSKFTFEFRMTINRGFSLRFFSHRFSIKDGWIWCSHLVFFY